MSLEQLGKYVENGNEKESKAMAERLLNEGTDPLTILNTLTGPLRKASAQAGKPDLVSLWAGQAAGMHRALPAGELLDALVRETEAVLKRF